MNKNHCLKYWLNMVAYLLASGGVAHEAIIGGDEAKEDQFPYHIAILDPIIGYICGGSILSDQFVVTAAHCVTKPNGGFIGASISVLAGSNDLRKTSEPAMSVPVKKVYVPMQYTPWIDGATGDIAVLKLKQPLKLSKHIKKVGLPKHVFESYSGETATISGFGWEKIKLQDDRPVALTTNTRLLYAVADILNNSEHQSASTPRLSEKHLLARITSHPSKERSPCMGDSGSPLVHDHALVGVLAMSPNGCTEKQIPSIYTRVSRYLDFIHDATHDKTNKNIRAYILIL